MFACSGGRSRALAGPRTSASHGIAGRRLRLCRTQSSKGEQSSGAAQGLDSSTVFAGKLLAGTFVGAATVKYGSLLLALPFEPNLGVALLFVCSPVLLFALLFWQRSL